MNRTALHWPGYYDVVILPPAAVRIQAVDLSQRLYGIGGQWRLGGRNFLPHVSLYHIPVLDKNLAPFLEQLQLVVDSAEWGFLETTGFDIPVMTVSKPEWLKKLHQSVVHRTVRYFDRKYGAEKMWNLHRFSGRRLKFAKQYLQEYGTPMCGMNFRPHITLSSFKGKELPDIDLHFRPKRFLPDRLYVCELGQSHTCHRIIRELLPRKS